MIYPFALLLATVLVIGFAVCNWRWAGQLSKLTIALQEMENRMNEKITKFLEDQKAFNDRQETAATQLGEALTGLTDDIQTLNDKITELQNSSGEVTAEDQATLDALTTQGEALTVKAEAFAAAIAALNALTPPKVPAA